MKTQYAVLLACGLVLCSACEDSSLKSAVDAQAKAVDVSPNHVARGSVVLESASAAGRYDSVPVLDVDALVTLWRRADGTCYMSVHVNGWKAVFINASGPVCDSAPNKRSVVVEPASPITANPPVELIVPYRPGK